MEVMHKYPSLKYLIWKQIRTTEEHNKCPVLWGQNGTILSSLHMEKFAYF